jgi:hypothetical protein
VAQSPLFDFTTTLADHLIELGRFCAEVGKDEAALQSYGEGIECWNRLADDRLDWVQGGWIRGRRLRFRLLLRLHRWREAAVDMAHIAAVGVNMGSIPSVLDQVAGFANDWIDLGRSLADTEIQNLMEALAQQPQGDRDSLFARVSQGMACPNCGEWMHLSHSGPAWVCDCQGSRIKIPLTE